MIEIEMDVEDECYRCGYDLRGIANEQACPECGLVAERSRRVTDELHNTRPRWLRKLAMGVWLVLVSMALAWPILYGQRVFRVTWSVPMVGYLAPVTFLVGIWLLTSPEGYEPADRVDRRRRFLVRWLGFAPLLVVLTWQAMQFVEFTRIMNYSATGIWTEGPAWEGYVLPAVIALGGAPMIVSLFYHLRCLARRARSAHPAEDCLIVGIGAAGALMYGVVLQFMGARMQRGIDPFWILRSNVVLGLFLSSAVASLLFVLWSLYLLIRFAIAFHLAARQLRKTWASADRSLVPAHGNSASTDSR